MAPAKVLDGAAADSAVAPVNKVLRVRGESSSPSGPRLPSAAYLPLIVILSLTISSLGYSSINEWTRGELSAIARPLVNSEAALLIGWRIIELSLGWYGKYDGIDLAVLSLLSRGPTIYLLTTFYNIRPTTAAATLLIDILSSALPYQLLRPLSAAHAPRSHPSTANRDIITDVPLLAYSGILVALVYAVTVFAALSTFLPSTFVLYFPSIPSIQPAVNATLLWPSAHPASGLLAVLFGAAAPLFLFTPAAATTEEDDPQGTALRARFDPAEAGLAETLWWNLWGYTPRAKMVIARTAVLVLATWVGTFLQLSLTVYGIEPTGAAIYAAVWAFAATLAGGALQFVGSA